MDGKQLKNSILQWAIQGKLVPQNPKDEPAQKLLERIIASRNGDESCHPERSAKGTKSKDLTKKKSSQSSRIYHENGIWYEQIDSAAPKDISDEIPFEIPENWAWCRLSYLVSLLSDGIHGTPSYSDNGPYYFVNGNNLKDCRIIIKDSTKRISAEEYEKYKKPLNENTILVSINGTIGNIGYYNNEPIILGKSACYFNLLLNDLKEYITTCLKSPYFLLYALENATGTTIKNVSLKTMNDFIIPLPPLAEQKRIVAKLEQVLPLAEEYGAAQEQLDKLNKELPEALKKSILQEAIQGKLVPQNPKDEPAQKLLEKIAHSRHSKRSEESSKRSKKASKDLSSRIYRENGIWYEQIGSDTPKDITDEIPFEIPETWAWCRLGNCSDYAASKEKAKSFDDIQEMWSLDLEDIEKNSGRIVKRLKVSERKIVGEKVVFKKGQVLYSKLRPYLKKILVAPEDGVCSSEIVPFSPFECLNASYLVTVLKSPHVDYTINLVTYGVKMPRVGTDTMLNLLIPIPPLAEQKRIVAKLEQLFKIL